jgi:hypothetical protein
VLLRLIIINLTIMMFIFVYSMYDISSFAVAYFSYLQYLDLISIHFALYSPLPFNMCVLPKVPIKEGISS